MSTPPPSASAPPLFTPIWDYDRFPVGPCVRERHNRLSLDHQPIDYFHHHSPQSNSSSGPMMRSASSTTASSSTSVIGAGTETGANIVHSGTGPQSRHGSRHGSRSGSRTLTSQTFVPHGSDGADTSASPSNSNISSHHPSPSHIESAQTPHNHHQQQQGEASLPSLSHQSPPATMSKFDHYKAQMDRVRSTRVSTTTPSSSPCSGKPTDFTHSTSISAPLPSSAASLTKKDKKRGFLSRLFKKKPKQSCQKSPQPPTQSQPEPQIHTQTQMQGHRTMPSSPGSASSRSSLLNEKEARTQRPHPVSTRPSDPEKNTNIIGQSNDLASTQQDRPAPGSTFASAPASASASASAAYTAQSLDQRSPIEEQQDRWRDEWLRPSGAIHSLFRDRPSKFNCPHCGAIKVVSNIQFAPGVMSYLVAFGLLFLTLGTLSYLPFRKGHEGTKDCIHWCPQCEQKVARFNRANATWEWI
ncbi:hypothetical protein BG011_006866 [Mortierella polycephala]|uniref:LITAF domain-containing protein n=1 Tax=Mortierella polycephala TaxID=41804 RepID=A0A9P6TZF9_9FUNG|nr:hypothetical protein BG011_006866 [Mortierella polycephala]